MRIVFDPHGNFLRAILMQRGSDIDAKGCVAAVVFDNEHVIDPHLGAIIDGPEMQQDEVIFFLYFEFPLIPAGPMKTGIANPARPAFGCEWNPDRTCPMRYILWDLALQLIVKGKTPIAIQ